MHSNIFPEDPILKTNPEIIYLNLYLYQGGEEERIVCSKPEDPRQSMMGAERVVETQF